MSVIILLLNQGNKGLMTNYHVLHIIVTWHNLQTIYNLRFYIQNHTRTRSDEFGHVMPGFKLNKLKLVTHQISVFELVNGLYHFCNIQ